MPFDFGLIGKRTEVSVYTYSTKEPILYALGIGAKKDELDYLYEGRGPKVYPGFAVVPKFPALLDVLGKSGGNMAMVVHGSERINLFRPFASAGRIHTTATIRGIYDLRRLAVMLVDTESKDEAGDLLATTTSSIIFRGEGGFGGDPPPKEKEGIVVPKDRAADFRVEEATTPEQALLYRLSGDPNPLHADPQFAEGVGFPQGPILHGLCTFGHMIRHVAKGALAGDASPIESIEGQFKKPVWPGDTLVTEGWRVGPNEIALHVSVKERSEIVLGGAWVRLKSKPE